MATEATALRLLKPVAKSRVIGVFFGRLHPSSVDKPCRVQVSRARSRLPNVPLFPVSVPIRFRDAGPPPRKIPPRIPNTGLSGTTIMLRKLNHVIFAKANRHWRHTGRC